MYSFVKGRRASMYASKCFGDSSKSRLRGENGQMVSRIDRGFWKGMTAYSF